MLQSTIILSLFEQLAKEGDAERRADLIRAAERQYYLDMEHQSNFVQTRIGALELDIREQVATSLGTTNEMISQVAADSRKTLEVLAANTAATEGLRSETQAGFRDVYGAVNAIGERVTHNEARIDAVEARMDRSEADRKVIHKELADASAERAAMAASLSRIEAQLAGSPTLEPEERATMAAWLVEFIRRSMARESGDGG